jgi:hypothetical protein
MMAPRHWGPVVQKTEDPLWLEPYEKSLEREEPKNVPLRWLQWLYLAAEEPHEVGLAVVAEAVNVLFINVNVWVYE